jgi:hypothetical protein
LKKLSAPILIFLALASDCFLPAEGSSDEKGLRDVSTTVSETLASYQDALHAWKTPEEINAWIASNFSYDMNRSMRLSETQVTRQGQPTIYPPSKLFDTKSGTCVDLSRFAVETLRVVDPQCDATYLMIEFNPITIDGNVLRRHWLVSFERDGQKYFFADSNRPGHIFGPFIATEEFIREYERDRGRRIVEFRQLESYQKSLRARTAKLKASQKP